MRLPSRRFRRRGKKANLPPYLVRKRTASILSVKKGERSTKRSFRIQCKILKEKESLKDFEARKGEDPRNITGRGGGEVKKEKDSKKTFDCPILFAPGKSTP